jgi:ribonuclease HII
MTQGESKSTSIAAASIIAKVTRDRLMARISDSFPGYGLAQHKGYCTKLHQDSTLVLKPTIIHRNSYLAGLMKDELDDQQSIIW